tara:strand:- start:414 stop:1205 length:792 start_codon:yes stop_codon:yes gene_type:complete
MNVDDVAFEVFEAIKSSNQIQPFSGRNFNLSNSEAYQVARKVFQLRGWENVGRKIGFTNRSIWPIYSVNEPMWGFISTSSVVYAENNTAAVNLSGFCEPRIEPEVVIGLKNCPQNDSSIEQIVKCVGWVAPGVEIVDSIYPNWKFSVPDTIAAGGLHGKLIIGQKVEPTKNINELLINQKVCLSKNGEVIEKGSGDSVLNGPISAIQYLLRGIDKEKNENSLSDGDIVTTGTLTDAKPIYSGETWTALFEGIINTRLKIEFLR